MCGKFRVVVCVCGGVVFVVRVVLCVVCGCGMRMYEYDYEYGYEMDGMWSMYV